MKHSNIYSAIKKLDELDSKFKNLIKEYNDLKLEILNIKKGNSFLDDIIDAIEVSSGLTGIRSKSRKLKLIQLRSIYYQIGVDFGYSLKKIGFHCGGRDHSTVFNGLKKKIENTIDQKTLDLILKRSQTLSSPDKISLLKTRQRTFSKEELISIRDNTLEILKKNKND